MLNDFEIKQELERAAHARRLHGLDRTCVICGESRQRCLQLHHLPERGYGNELVPVCANCHLLITDRRNNKPAPENPSQLERIGHWLLALAQFLFELARRALQFGDVALEAAKVCPAPYGCVPVVSQ